MDIRAPCLDADLIFFLWKGFCDVHSSLPACGAEHQSKELKGPERSSMDAPHASFQSLLEEDGRRNCIPVRFDPIHHLGPLLTALSKSRLR